MPKYVPAPISIRLDAESEQQLRRLARERGATLSAVVREAVLEFGDTHDRSAAAGSRPYDRIHHLIGVVDRHADRSERTGEKVRTLLRTRARARHSR